MGKTQMKRTGMRLEDSKNEIAGTTDTLQNGKEAQKHSQQVKGKHDKQHNIARIL
jgi:hypothetical protein